MANFESYILSSIVIKCNLLKNNVFLIEYLNLEGFFQVFLFVFLFFDENKVIYWY
jgi:hypothetical protein